MPVVGEGMFRTLIHDSVAPALRAAEAIAESRMPVVGGAVSAP